jgi:hemerythrin-like domain-containing protein
LSDVVDWLYHDHREHEANLYECQALAEQEDWRGVKRVYDELRRAIERHIAAENDIIFPAYEALADTSETPTRLLREEHDQVLVLLGECAAVISMHDSEQAVASLSFMADYMIKHHDREEQMFLPMAGHALAAQREEILERLKPR